MAGLEVASAAVGSAFLVVLQASIQVALEASAACPVLAPALCQELVLATCLGLVLGWAVAASFGVDGEADGVGASECLPCPEHLRMTAED